MHVHLNIEMIHSLFTGYLIETDSLLNPVTHNSHCKWILFAYGSGFGSIVSVVCRTKAVLASRSLVSRVWRALGDDSSRSAGTTLKPVKAPFALLIGHVYPIARKESFVYVCWHCLPPRNKMQMQSNHRLNFSYEMWISLANLQRTSHHVLHS